MATALGFVLGAPGGVLGGLLGYVVATGSDYEGDRVHNSEAEAWYLLELEALRIAAEVTESLVGQATWDEICNKINDELEILSAISDPLKTSDLANIITRMSETVGERIQEVDLEAHSIFNLLHEEARRNLT